jgi:hypothetical protein
VPYFVVNTIICLQGLRKAMKNLRIAAVQDEILTLDLTNAQKCCYPLDSCDWYISGCLNSVVCNVTTAFYILIIYL